MKYAVIYSSKTGNTQQLAKQIKECISAEDTAYYGVAEEYHKEADIIFAGFWTDKGTCDEGMNAFLKSLHGKKVFLFGTAGFGGDAAYFQKILSRVQESLDDSNMIAGTYMCQGKMPMTVRNRYESMLAGDREKVQPMLDNFDQALSHPDKTDLLGIKRAVQEIIAQIIS